MMSYTTSAAWSRPDPSSCCTEYDQCCGAILSGRITTVVMSMSGQLGRRCTASHTVAARMSCRRLGNTRVCLENT
jgi:hypothetical protein